MIKIKDYREHLGPCDDSQPAHLQEMSRIGTIGNYEVYVNTNDAGQIPHFHFRDMDEWDKFHACIRSDSARYFPHNGKRSRLNSKLRKELVEFLNSKHRRLPVTNWEYLLIQWNDNNSKVVVDESIKMPDYLTLR